VSITTSVTSRAQQYSQGKLRLKRWVFRRLWKTGSDCADVTWCSRPFQTREAATGKARSPYVDSRVRGTTRHGDEGERRRCRASTSAVWHVEGYTSKALRHGTCVTRDHTVLPASTHTQTIPSRKASPPFGWYSSRLPTKGWPG